MRFILDLFECSGLYCHGLVCMKAPRLIVMCELFKCFLYTSTLNSQFSLFHFFVLSIVFSDYTHWETVMSPCTRH